MIFRRLLHQTSKVPIYTNNVLTSNQSLLSTLRKKTGYAISNCKKALEINNNDLAKAETWLNVQAQAQGWAKAAKVQSRSTPNGLIGLVLKNNSAVMVEINCETDFVAKNEKFQSLVAQSTEICSTHSLKTWSSTSQSSHDLGKVGYTSEQLGLLKSSDNTTLADLIALNIGQIGENMVLRRGAGLFSADEKIKFSCSTHPQMVLAEALLGKYGAVIAYEETTSTPTENPELSEIINIDTLPKQLCQHIIGMNPKTVHSIKKETTGEETSQPTENVAKPPEETATPSEETAKPSEEMVKPSEETALVNQEFLAHPDYSVGEVLAHVGWNVKGFLRFECGESLESTD